MTARGRPRLPRRARRAGLCLPVALLLLAPAPSLAVELSRATFSGGALDVTAGAPRLRATVGEAGVVGRVATGSLILVEGFWGGRHRLLATGVPFPLDAAPTWTNGLRPAFPNPFRGAVAIEYSVGRPARVDLSVFDVTGRRVATLARRTLAPGAYRTRWDGRDAAGVRVASGVYFTRLVVGDWSTTDRLVKIH